MLATNCVATGIFYKKSMIEHEDAARGEEEVFVGRPIQTEDVIE